MPANLTPQYQAAEARFRAASTTVEKISCLQEMLPLLPKHKGTEKIFADLKRRLSRLQRTEVRAGSGSKRVPGEYVDADGARQVLLVGGPNSGKSSLLAAVTGAKPDIAEYPYTTTKLAPGMMPVLDITVQVVDAPALTKEFAKPWMKNQLLAADLALWVVSLADDDLLDGVEDTMSVLAEWGVHLAPGAADQAEGTAVPAVLVATHADDAAADLRLELLMESIGDRWSPAVVSTTSGAGLDDLQQRVFDGLDAIRVYTKVPGKKADMTSPFVLDRGATVLELAAAVHRKLADTLAFARLWGEGAYDGQRVTHDHELSDGDIVELHG